MATTTTPAAVIREGDRIAMVNQVEGESGRMMEELRAGISEAKTYADQYIK